MPKSKAIRAEIDLLTDHPSSPKKGDKRVFFLNGATLDPVNWYAANDIRFCVQPASMATELKQMAEEMARLSDNPLLNAPYSILPKR